MRALHSLTMAKPMTRTFLLPLLAAALLVVGVPDVARAQLPESRLPFYYSVHGGLFFPSRENFRQVYRSSSDLVWGAGIAFPITDDFLYLITDLAWFSAEGSLGTDSTARLEERFIHVGLLQKVFFAAREAIRIQAGGNSIRVRESVRGPLTGETGVELPRKFGYYGGIGLEHLLGGGAALYSDLLYEYRRSLEPALPGDVGGVRLEIGINVNFN